uniref:Putative secreted protein n=1 Tax=Anopheles darlingi TaxID=43151 RepID=A0A2M4DJA9_ANODA
MSLQCCLCVWPALCVLISGGRIQTLPYPADAHSARKLFQTVAASALLCFWLPPQKKTSEIKRDKQRSLWVYCVYSHRHEERHAIAVNL